MQEFAFLTVIMLLVLGGYWSFYVFPRQREFNKRQKYVRSLHEGDEVVTFGGMVGKVRAIDSEAGVAHVEIAEGLVVRFVIASIVSEYDPEQLAENARRAEEPYEE